MRKPFLAILLFFALVLGAVSQTKLTTGSYLHEGDLRSTPTTEYNVVERDGQSKTLIFSNDMVVWLHDIYELRLYENALEHDTGAAYYLNAYLYKGQASFKLKEAPSENSLFLLQTESAEFEIHSSEFWIEGGPTLSYVRCFKGSITLTNTMDFSVAVVHEGEEATITGYDGDKNLRVRTRKMPVYRLERWEELKMTEPSSVHWVDKNGIRIRGF